MKKIIFRILLILVFLEVMAYFAMKVIDRNPSPRLTAPVKFTLSQAQRDSIPGLISGNGAVKYDQTTGWANPEQDHIRSNREHSLTPEPGHLRVAVFGDSFTHGDEVKPEEAFPEVLNTLDARIDSLNFGVSRFGLDQAYLTYMEYGRPFKPDIVLICFMPENILRQVNVFNPFYAQGDTLPVTKPRFVLEGEKLKLIPNPFQTATGYRALLDDEKETLVKLGENDFFFLNYKWTDTWELTPAMRLFQHVLYTAKRKMRLKQIMTRWGYRDDSEALRLTMKIMEAFSSAVKEQGSRPVIVIVPRYQDLWAYVARGKKYYDPLLNQLEKRKLDYLDGHEAFSSYLKNSMTAQEFDDFKKKFFNPGEHYSPEGNKVFAGFLYRSILKTQLNP